LKIATNILLNRLQNLPGHGVTPSSAGKKKKARDAIDVNVPLEGQAQKDLADFNAKVVKATKSLPKFTKIVTALSQGMKGFESNLAANAQGLGKVIGLTEDLAAKQLALIKNVTFLEERNAALNKSFGLNAEGANKFSLELRRVAISSEVGGEKMFKYAESLKGLTAGFLNSEKGMNAYSQQLLLGQQYLQNNMGLTEESSLAYEQYAASIGKSGVEAAMAQNELASALAKQTGMDATQLQKDLLEGISSVSGDIVGQYSKMPGNLEVAVLKANALGTSMDKLHGAGESLLDIESSVSKEIEYQQLTGKRLLDSQGKSLTNEYRMATIRGDGARQAELMAKFIEEEGDNLENNMFARKKAAELFGMQEGDMMRMKRQRDILASMGAEQLLELEAGDVEAIADKLRADGASKTDVEAFIKASDTRTTAQISADYLKSIDEKMIAGEQVRMESDEENITKLRDASRTYVDNAETMRQEITGLKKVMGDITIMSEKFGAITSPLSTISEELPVFGEGLTKIIATVKKGLIDLKSGTPVTGVADSGGDILSLPGGNRTLITPDVGGLMKFTNIADEDLLIAAPVETASPGGGNNDIAMMVTAMIRAIQNITVEAKITKDMFNSETELNSAREY